MGLLTALYLQGAVLLIQWISSQVHHTCSCGSYPGNICDGDTFNSQHGVGILCAVWFDS